MIIIENVMVVNYNKVIENANLTIENQKIKKIVVKKGKPRAICIPGFIDPHIHGFANLDVMDSEDAILKINQLLLAQGITSWMPTLMTNKWEKILESLKDVFNAQKKSPSIVGSHLEGPFISPKKKGAHNPQYLRQLDSKQIQELVNASSFSLKKITFAPEVCSNLEDVLLTFKKNQIIASIGHTNANWELVNKAIKWGARLGTHLWNAMSGVINRNQGAVGALLNDPQTYVEMIGDLIHVDKLTWELSTKIKGFDKIVLVSDAIRPAGLNDGVYQSGSMEIVKKGDLITLASSPEVIAGSGSSIWSMFKLLHKNFKYSLEKLVCLTSYNSAISHNLKNVGLIQENYDADLVLLNLDANQILKVYAKGKLCKF